MSQLLRPTHIHLPRLQVRFDKSAMNALYPTLHPSFSCLFDYLGSGPYPMVLTYIHRSLRAFAPTLFSTPTRSLYYSIISLNTSKQGCIYLYNIYNSSHEEALLELSNFDSPPPAFTIVGDFNLHSPNWDTSSKPSPMSSLHQLHDVMVRLNVSLASTPDVLTWFPPANSTHRPSVIDLAWTDTSRPTPRIDVLTNPGVTFNSDHATLSFTLSTKFYTPDPSLSIPVTSEEHDLFINELTHLISDLPSLYDYASRDHLQCEVTLLFDGIRTAFN